MDIDTVRMRDGYPFCLWESELPGWYENLSRQVVFKDCNPDIERRYEELKEINTWVLKNLSKSEYRVVFSLRYDIYKCTEEAAFKLQLTFGDKIQKIWRIEDEDFYERI